MTLGQRTKLFEETLRIGDIVLVLEPELHSKLPDHRANIRKLIPTFVAPVTAGDMDRLSDLSKPPELSDFDVSISHCPVLGGFLAVRKPYFAGLDAEVAERVAGKHVERLSTPLELELMPDPSTLWTAKEAAFKAFSKAHGLTVAADAVIDSAIADKSSAVEYTAHSKKEPDQTGRGWVFSHEGARVAVFFSSGKALPFPK